MWVRVRFTSFAYHELSFPFGAPVVGKCSKIGFIYALEMCAELSFSRMRPAESKETVRVDPVSGSSSSCATGIRSSGKQLL